MHKKSVQLQPPSLCSVGNRLRIPLCRACFEQLRLVVNVNRIHIQLLRFDLVNRSQAFQTCVPRERGMQVDPNGIHGYR